MQQHKAAKEADNPLRPKNWREHWARGMWEASYHSGMGEWEVFPHVMLAGHDPTGAAFQLCYRGDLLETVKFLPRRSYGPASGWNNDSPEIRELVFQITRLYLLRW
jgi:hypothetical protein